MDCGFSIASPYLSFCYVDCGFSKAHPYLSCCYVDCGFSIAPPYLSFCYVDCGFSIAPPYLFRLERTNMTMTTMIVAITTMATIPPMIGPYVALTTKHI